MTETTPFEHKVTPRHTEFRLSPELTEVTIQDAYGALINDTARNEMIGNDVVRAVESGRCPLLLTGRTEHVQFFATRLAGFAQHVFVLKGGMGKKQRRETAVALASVPEAESRVILATGSYIGEGFDDARLDTLFLAMPIRLEGHAAAVCGPTASAARQQAICAGLRLCGQLRSDASQDVRAALEGRRHNRVRHRAGGISTAHAIRSLSIVEPACQSVNTAFFPARNESGRSHYAAHAWQMGLTQLRKVIKNGACMEASWQIVGMNGDTKLVTNSVTNPAGNRGQSRATVTNSVTKLRAIQGNEITIFGESWAMEGN